MTPTAEDVLANGAMYEGQESETESEAPLIVTRAPREEETVEDVDVRDRGEPVDSRDLVARARAARRASLTPHQRAVEDLSDDYALAVESGDILGFFERTAARIVDTPRLDLRSPLVRKMIASLEHARATVDELIRKLKEAGSGEVEE